MDFGGLKAFKEWAEYTFDHTLIVAEDDPHLNFFKQMSHLGDPPTSGTGSITNVKPHERKALCDLRIVEAVGCEKFAELAYKEMAKILHCFRTDRPYRLLKGNEINSFEARYPIGLGVRLRSAEVFEHEGNSAIYEG